MNSTRLSQMPLAKASALSMRPRKYRHVDSIGNKDTHAEGCPKRKVLYPLRSVGALGKYS